MTTIDDHAETPDEWVRAEDASGVYRLETRELTPADEIGGEYPEFGKFLSVVTVQWHSGDDRWIDGDPLFLECPRGLSQSLVAEPPVEAGDVFAIGEPQKDNGNEWRFTTSKPDSPDDLL